MPIEEIVTCPLYPTGRSSTRPRTSAFHIESDMDPVRDFGDSSSASCTLTADAEWLSVDAASAMHMDTRVDKAESRLAASIDDAHETIQKTNQTQLAMTAEEDTLMDAKRLLDRDVSLLSNLEARQRTQSINGMVDPTAAQSENDDKLHKRGLETMIAVKRRDVVMDTVDAKLQMKRTEAAQLQHVHDAKTTELANHRVTQAAQNVEAVRQVRDAHVVTNLFCHHYDAQRQPHAPSLSEAIEAATPIQMCHAEQCYRLVPSKSDPDAAAVCTVPKSSVAPSFDKHTCKGPGLALNVRTLSSCVNALREL